MYEMVYQISAHSTPEELAFNTEKDMESHYNIWLSGDDYYYCDFFYCGRQYFPTWA